MPFPAAPFAAAVIGAAAALAVAAAAFAPPLRRFLPALNIPFARFPSPLKIPPITPLTKNLPNFATILVIVLATLKNPSLIKVNILSAVPRVLITLSFISSSLFLFPSAFA